MSFGSHKKGAPWVLLLALFLFWGCSSGSDTSESNSQNNNNVNNLECQFPGDCIDGDPCTTDECIDGHCVHNSVDSTECSTNDGTNSDTNDGTGTGCTSATQCDDGNPCTTDECRDGTCVNDPVEDGQGCDDGNGCTSGDTCQAGECVPGTESCCSNGQDDDGDGVADCDDPDCATDAACSGQCPVVNAPPMPGTSPLPGENPPGRYEATTVNGFHDHYVYDSADYLKVGVRAEWGGSIVFFGMANGSPGLNGTNAIDANDTGREVQVAFYDPDRQMQNCAWNASCQSTPSDCPNSITYLGWNPVQGGNRCNIGSGVESVDATAGVMTVSTIPLFWNPNWDRTDCSSDACDIAGVKDRRSDVRVIQKLRFVRRHVVELEYELQNLSDLDHAAAYQEMPTVYTANGNNGPDLWRLFNSDGQEIAIDQPGNDGFYFKNFTSPGGWATMQNDDLSYGVALYTENRITQFQGWQNRSLPFNNFRPLQVFAIPAHGTVRARAYLILGSLSTVTAEAQWLDQNLPPFGWLDGPTPDQNVSGTITVRGWALDNKGVSAVWAVIDGTTTVNLPYGTSRPDVCKVWPGYPSCPNVGFEGQLDTTTLTSCPHVIEIQAQDSDGNVRTIAAYRFFVQN